MMIGSRGTVSGWVGRGEMSSSSEEDEVAEAGPRRETLAQNVEVGRIAPITVLSIFDSMLLHVYGD